MYFLVAQTVKNLPAVQETWVQSLGWEDPLEKGMETHSSVPAWRIPWTEKPGELQAELEMTERITLFFHMIILGKIYIPLYTKCQMLLDIFYF